MGETPLRGHQEWATKATKKKVTVLSPPPSGHAVGKVGEKTQGFEWGSTGKTGEQPVEKKTWRFPPRTGKGETSAGKGENYNKRLKKKTYNHQKGGGEPLRSSSRGAGESRTQFRRNCKKEDGGKKKNLPLHLLGLKRVTKTIEFTIFRLKKA